MVTKTKRTIGEPTLANDRPGASRRGGGFPLVTEGSSASTKSKRLGERGLVAVEGGAKTSAGEESIANEESHASRKTNGHSEPGVKTKIPLNGHSGGGPRLEDEIRDASTESSSSEHKLANGARHAAAAAGEAPLENGTHDASRKNNGRLSRPMKPSGTVNGHGGNGGEPQGDAELAPASICRQLQELQRRKSATLKSRIMIDNQLAALVSTELGYHAGMEEVERKALRKKAESLIKSISDDEVVDSEFQVIAERINPIVISTRIGRDGFNCFLKGIEKEMVRLVSELPIAKWVEDQDRRSVGLLSLATIIGEAGNLSNYPNPAKLWRRLGLAPFNNKMPSTWRRDGGLSSEQWTEIGYSPRRRSLMYVIGENIVRQNKGSYRKRYDETKAAAKVNHADWTDAHCHNHGMLLATKRLVLDVWKEWRRV